MTASPTLTPERFLAKFFGEGNTLDLTQDRVARHLQPWTARVLERKSPLLLPRVEKDGSLTWYALASSAQGARELREELMAAVGTSYSDFRGVGARLSGADPVEAAVLSFSGPFAFRLPVVNPEMKDACRRALARMLKLHDSRPRRQGHQARIPGLILRDLELALRQQDREAADSSLDELRAGGHVDGLNLRFLQVRCHEAFGEWSSIEEEVEEGTLLAVRRPARVTQALLRAVYQLELADFEDQLRASDALAHFEAAVQTRIQPLMETRAGMPAPDVAKLFMLKAAASGDPQLRDSLLEGAVVAGVDKVYLRALAELVPDRAPTAPSSEDEATEAFLLGDKDLAFELLVEGGGGNRRMAMLLQCALEIGSFRAAELALAEVEKLGQDERTALDAHTWLSAHLHELEERYTAPAIGVPSDWLDWVGLAASGALDDNKALELARQGAAEWSLHELESRPGDVTKLAAAVLDIEGPGKRQLRLALPHLQEFLLSRDEVGPSLKPILRSLLELYALDDAQSPSTWRAASEILAALVRCSLTDEEYAGAIDLLEVLLGDALPLELVDDSLDLLEALVVLAPGRPETVRASAFVHGGLQRWWERLGHAQVELFNQLGRELGTGVVLAVPREQQESGEPAGLGRLEAKTVALYSLNERALARVQATLQKVVEGVRVLAFSDRAGGSDALRSAARSADVFLIVTGAAKHAATEYIEANRGKGLLTLRSHAKGSASMLRALEEAPAPA